ncbi:barstar family protein [Streptomyces sp. NPDC088341]|uniref:barstar family protein n=1 Tax=Streptomyces sp. NPDC088341 TaxID=3154870 RepID=UPI0034156602
MKEIPWWTARSPWLHPTTPESTESLINNLPPPGITFTARMDGTAMNDADGVFTEFYKKFRLPDYFGWNWAALRDCLRDLNWITANQYLLVVRNSSHVLSVSQDERKTFLRILTQSAEDWARPQAKAGGAGIPFNVIFEEEENALNALAPAIGEIDVP